ncbi:MAG: hypothetical protein WCQ95_08200 [Bacteroidota bacterium]
MKPTPTKKIFVFLLIVFLSFSGFSQTLNRLRPIVLFDLTTRNGEETDANFAAFEHLIQLAGMQYIVTDDVGIATQYNVVVCSSTVFDDTFTASERTLFTDFVNTGGVWIVACLKSPALNTLFGVSANLLLDTRFSFKFNWQAGDFSMRWLDDDAERTFSLGDSITSPTGVMFSRSYTPSTASVIATYGDNTVAAVKNNYGQGCVYAFGFDFIDVITLPQMNYDYDAQLQSWSNNFVPSADVFFLFIKAVYAHCTPFGTWKHTVPFDKRYPVIMTHDIDAIQSMDTMNFYADYEYQNHINATYNITTRYFEDEVDIDYYNTSKSKVAYVLSMGQTLGSHSVSHQMDFDNPLYFPEGSPGQTEATYLPFFDFGLGHTVGGSVFAECEVSRDLLEADFGQPIRTFRAGYLCYPAVLPTVLDSLGYTYNSSYCASDVLTNFPYMEYKDLSFFEGISKIREIPLTFDTDYDLDSMTPTNYIAKANRWLDVIQKISNNYGAVVFLLHPVLYYKLLAQQYIYDNLPNGYIKMEMGEYGDYWQAREDFDFTDVMLNDSVMQITIPDNLSNLSDKLSLIINDGQSLSGLVVKNQSGATISYYQSNWETNDLCIYFYPNTTGVDEAKKPDRTEYIKNYPNPFSTSTTFEYLLKEKTHVKLQLFDGAYGEICCLVNQDEAAGPHILKYKPENLNSGVYFYTLTTTTGRYSGKLVFIK